jgi:hypothetical protein
MIFLDVVLGSALIGILLLDCAELSVFIDLLLAADLLISLLLLVSIS